MFCHFLNLVVLELHANSVPLLIMSEKLDCYVCKSTNLTNFRDRDGFLHLICNSCHLMWLHSSHLVSSNKLYNEAYFDGRIFEQTDGKLGYAKCYSNSDGSYRVTHYRSYIDIIRKLDFASNRSSLKVLDFGCAYGTFLRNLMNTMGGKVEVHGIDVDAQVCIKTSSKLDGAPIYCVDMKTNSEAIPQHYFDVITMLDVLEHLDDPRMYLQRLAECATAGGYLLLSTTNIESLNARLYGDKWILHGAPYHVHYFGPRSIRILLQQSGWEIVKLYTERTIFHNERSGFETWRGRLARALFQNQFWDFITNKLFSIGSIMVVIAQRK